MSFNFEYALVCRDLPNSLLNGLSLSEHTPVDLEEARIQHANYLNYLKESGVKLIEIDADERYPDCVFVEDIAVAVNNKILITNPGAVSRRDEAINVANKFNQIADELKLNVNFVKNKQEAFIDGGDVCYTGREFMVGLSSRTNLKGLFFLFIFLSLKLVIKIIK